MLQLITFKEWKEWKETLDKGGGYDGLFIDLSFDSLLDDLQLNWRDMYLVVIIYPCRDWTIQAFRGLAKG